MFPTSLSLSLPPLPPLSLSLSLPLSLSAPTCFVRVSLSLSPSLSPPLSLSPSLSLLFSLKVEVYDDVSYHKLTNAGWKLRGTTSAIINLLLTKAALDHGNVSYRETYR